MKSSSLMRASVVLALACSSPSPLGAQQARSAPATLARPQVLILGTYHMGGSSDYIQTSTDDVLSPRRQREIEALVNALAAFRPTKIMVEAPLAHDSALNARFRRYAAGQDTLRRNEIDQIGFRLAKRSGHSRVYAIDYSQDEDIGLALSPHLRDTQREADRACSARYSRGDFIFSAECGATSL